MIQDLILKTSKIEWQSIQDLQPHDLKNDYHSNKVKESIIKNGFSRAIYVWDSGDGIYCVDGHLRMDILREIKSDGIEIPDKLSCTFLNLKNRDEAVKVLLQVFNTKANPINHNTLDDWLEDLNLDLKNDLEINLDDLHMDLSESIEIQEEETEGDDDLPESAPAITVKGDLYELGNHRLLCGDSTMIDDIEKLMDGQKAVLAHNDPPYGMKKEKDGIKNDNLNYDALLEFNKEWINLQFLFLHDNGSFYCWGIDEPLMDIYSNILKPLIKTQKATFRNLITWNRGCSASAYGSPIGSDKMRCYPPADEKCLFVMCGVQGFNNNADNYYESFEPIRKYIDDEIKKIGKNDKQIANDLGFRDGRTVNHWRAKSQWAFITEENYQKLQDYCKKNNNNAFKKEYDELKKEYDELKKEYYSTRAYFDNTHDNMTNVWDIGRTKGAEREQTGGHSTPKPLELCERVIKSSSPKGALITDWFLGSGSTLIACEKTNRKCYGIELDEKYCDVIVKRYIDFCKKNNKEYSVSRNGQNVLKEFENAK